MDDDDFDEEIHEMDEELSKEESFKTDNKLSEADNFFDYLLMTEEIEDNGNKPRNTSGCLGSVALFFLIGSVMLFGSII